MSASDTSLQARLLSAPLWVWQCLLLLLMCCVAYYPSLSVPFYMDDFSSIQENTLIYDWQGIGPLWQYAPLRIVGYLSFALNYQLGQFNPLGYHLVNMLVHLLAGLTLFALAKALLRTPRMQAHSDEMLLRWLPFFAALLFVLHPLHLQAVTYIVQRLASMAALFYLAAMLAYVQLRLSETHKRRLQWALVCALFAALGFFTKQNTATLPLALLLLEWVFFAQSTRRLLLITGAAIAMPLLVLLVMVFGFDYQPFSLQAMEAMTRETTEISRLDYLATQMLALWQYIGLFFWPTGLHLDHENLPLTGFNFPVILAMLGHLAVIAGAVWLVRRLPLVGFGLLFYYLAHGIESSLIPIRDVVFEHRTYLPDIGLCLVLVWGIFVLLGRYVHVLAAVALCSILALSAAYATWQRNLLWQDPIALWESNIKLAPGKPRAWSILGKHYLQANNAEKGVEMLNEAIRLQQLESGRINTTDLVNLIVGLKMLKRYDQALALTERILQQKIEPFLRAKFLINQGNIYFEMGNFAAAEQSMRQALQVFPQSILARANLASVLGGMGRLAEAEQLYKDALQYDPDNQVIRENLLKVQRARQQNGL